MSEEQLEYPVKREGLQKSSDYKADDGATTSVTLTMMQLQLVNLEAFVRILAARVTELERELRRVEGDHK